jgi:hypothetical protein
MNKQSRPSAEKRAPSAGAQPRKAAPKPPAPGVGVPRPAIQQKPRPQAPPAYRPQPAPRVLQRKASPAGQPAAPRQTPAAPPVYRPQQPPRVLQPKKDAGKSGAVLHGHTRPKNPPEPRVQPAPALVQMKTDPSARPHRNLPTWGRQTESRIVRPVNPRPTVVQALQAWNSPTQNAFAVAVLANVHGLAPVTPDAPAVLDLVAQHIVPTNSQNCAAVEDPGAPANFLYATNSNSPTPASIAAHGTGRLFTRINNPEPRLHAEMMIYTNNPAVGYIGISKRCCLMCAASLAVVGGVVTRGCHGEIFDTGWRMPAFIKGTPANLAAFLGAGAMAIYNLLSDASKMDAIRLVETNIKQYD